MNAETAAQARVEKWRLWESTPDRLWPSYEPLHPDRTELDDIAAVVAGSKPAALICINSIQPRHRSELGVLLRLAKEKGLATALEREKNGGPVVDLLVGLPPNVEALHRIVSEVHLKPGQCVELGRWLGYNPEGMEVNEAESEFHAQRLEYDDRRAREVWNQLPRYKKVSHILRSRLGYGHDLLEKFRFSRTMEVVHRALREPMPVEKLRPSINRSAEETSPRDIQRR